MKHPLVRLVLYAAGLLAALTLLHRAGATMPTSLSLTDPTLLVVAVLRHAAMAAGWYLVAATTVGALGRVGRMRLLVRAVDRVTLPSLRRLLDTSLGLSMMATVVGGSPAWAAPLEADERPPATMVRLRDEAPRSHEWRPEPPPVHELPPTSTTSTPTPPPPPPQAEQVSPPAEAPAAGDEWTVQAGDSFWSIAERVLARAWGRSPTDAETDPYWRRLVEANRHRLADRRNPDLVFAGQVFGLPPPAPARPPAPP